MKFIIFSEKIAKGEANDYPVEEVSKLVSSRSTRNCRFDAMSGKWVENMVSESEMDG